MIFIIYIYMSVLTMFLLLFYIYIYIYKIPQGCQAGIRLIPTLEVSKMKTKS